LSNAEYGTRHGESTNKSREFRGVFTRKNEVPELHLGNGALPPAILPRGSDSLNHSRLVSKDDCGLLWYSDGPDCQVLPVR